ncbi:hypothetical protein BDQ17DRAFT_1072781 [Cyathus striatus]|nr:hypothetical protein BDQ17DRAFT_1072781 [Cyathus striatus]
MPPRSSSSSVPLTQVEKDDAVRRRRKRRAELAVIRHADVEMLKNEGNDYFKKGQYVDAVVKYEEAIILGGENSHILSNLAAAQLKLERYAEVIGSATTALLYDPKNIKARYRRAMARKQRKQYTAALADFRFLHKLNPSLVDVKQELEALKQRLRDAGVDSEEEFGSDVEYPNPDDPPHEYFSDSDTSDCLHLGNGTPCRFYNRGKCKKGDKCRFSHAPDDMSIRDELGRNVCIFFLVSGCLNGEDECVYSHSLEFLPPGWWRSEEQREICE